jgi:hypothetical protein
MAGLRRNAGACSIFSYLEILDRNAPGERMAASDRCFAVEMATRRLVKRYGLAWDRTRPVNDDPRRADTAFDAALELAQELGVYNDSRGRVVGFTADELEAGLAGAPRAGTLGEGSDARTLEAREVCQKEPPRSVGAAQNPILTWTPQRGMLLSVVIA